MTTAQPLIQARGLVKRFGDFTAVDGIDVEVRPGEAFGFLGPNGAGKSSTMRMIGCVSPPTGGELRILGMDPVRDGPAIRARLGVCPQLDNLDPELTVRENLTIYARYFGIPRRVARERAAELLDFVQLTERADSKVEPLSGGMKRRLTIARALVNEPGDRAARRADHRPRPAGPAPGLGAAVPAQAAGRHAGAHHPLHGRGRAALRPARGDGRRPDRRRGLAPRADRASTPPGRWSSCASPPSRRRRSPASSTGSGSGSRCCPTGSCSTSPTATPRSPRCTARGLAPASVLVRRSSLEDVFLHLTGRTLVD